MCLILFTIHTHALMMSPENEADDCNTLFRVRHPSYQDHEELLAWS